MLKVAVEDVELTFPRKFQEPFAIVGGSVALQQIRVRPEAGECRTALRVEIPKYANSGLLWRGRN